MLGNIYSYSCSYSYKFSSKTASIPLWFLLLFVHRDKMLPVAVFVGSILEMRNLNVKFCTRNFVCGVMLLMIKSDMYNFYFLKRIRVVLLK